MKLLSWLFKHLGPVFLMMLIVGCNPFKSSEVNSRTPGSGGGNFDSAPPSVGGGSSITLTVEKLYPVNGSSWLKYISAGTSGSTQFDRVDTACAGSESGNINACFHGGDKLKITISQYSSCSGLEITDSESVFIWSCFVKSGQAVFYSTGFKSGKGLGDLIDFTAKDWKSMSVSLYQNSVLKGQSVSQKWWSTSTNPIVDLPDSSATAQVITGYSPGTILIASANMNSRGYGIDQDSVAIVTKPGSSINLTGSAQNCNYTDGETNTGANALALFCLGAQKYIWFEGEYNDPSNASDPLFSLYAIKFSTFHKLTVNNGPNGNLIYAVNSDYNRYTSFKVQKFVGTWSLLMYTNSSYNYFHDLTIAKVLSTSYYSLVDLDSNSHRNIITKATFAQHTRATVNVFGTNNILTDIVNLAGDRLSIAGNKNTISHMSSYAMSTAGLQIDPQGGPAPTMNTINQVFSGYNLYPVFFNGSTDTLASQLSIFTDAFWSLGFGMTNNTDSKFTNALIMSDSTHSNNCDVSGGVNQGLVNGTCAITGLSDALKITYPAGTTLTPVYGAIAGADTANPSSQPSGVVSASAITDFVNFSNRFRGWVDTAPSGIGPCDGTKNCAVFDIRFKSTDIIFRNTSGDGQNQNSAFVANAACPSAVHGNKAIVDQSDDARTFLINAQEIISDGIGNENGLCESSEACIYSPNFGAYQGDGDYKANGTCNFQNGTVSNVIMYAYPTNGI